MALLDFISSNGLFTFTAGTILTVAIVSILLIFWTIIAIHNSRKPLAKEMKLQRKEEKVEGQETEQNVVTQIEERNIMEDVQEADAVLPKIKQLSNFLLSLIIVSIEKIETYQQDKNQANLENIAEDLKIIVSNADKLIEYNAIDLARYKDVLEDAQKEIDAINKIMHDIEKERTFMKKEVRILKHAKGQNMDVGKKVKILRQKYILNNKLKTITDIRHKLAEDEQHQVKQLVDDFSKMNEQGTKVQEKISQDHKDWAEVLELLHTIKPLAEQDDVLWKKGNLLHRNSMTRMRQQSAQRKEMNEIQNEKHKFDQLYDSLNIKEVEQAKQEKEVLKH